MKREVRTIIKTALDKITAFVLSVLAAFSFAFGGDVLVEAGNAYSNWWTSPTPDNVRIEEYVENASINKDNSKIKEFHDYALNVTKLEIALRDHGKNAKIKENSAISQEEFEALNGKLAGLVDDFDYIIPVEIESPYFAFHAVKDGEITSYLFECSLVANKNDIIVNDNIHVGKMLSCVSVGTMTKNSFIKIYKSSDIDKMFYSKVLDIVREKIQRSASLQKLINDDYECIILPVINIPKVITQSSSFNESLTKITTISSGIISLQCLYKKSPKNDESYMFSISSDVTIFFINKFDNKILTQNCGVSFYMPSTCSGLQELFNGLNKNTEECLANKLIKVKSKFTDKIFTYYYLDVKDEKNVLQTLYDYGNILDIYTSKDAALMNSYKEYGGNQPLFNSILGKYDGEFKYER